MRKDGSLRGFVLGVVVGLMIGSAGLAAATFNYKGWTRFSDDFKVGYINGFLDMANLARNLEPGGWVDSKYPLIPGAKPLEYRKKVDELYAKPENQGYTITSILQAAAHGLEEKYGKPLPADERTRRRMLHQLDAVRRSREAKGLPPPKREPKLVEAPAKTVAPVEPVKKTEKKWCRCDGKYPKAERAKRRAAAAAAAAADPNAAAPAAGGAQPAPPAAEPAASK